MYSSRRSALRSASIWPILDYSLLDGSFVRHVHAYHDCPRERWGSRDHELRRRRLSTRSELVGSSSLPASSLAAEHTAEQWCVYVSGLARRSVLISQSTWCSEGRHESWHESQEFAQRRQPWGECLIISFILDILNPFSIRQNRTALGRDFCDFPWPRHDLSRCCCLFSL